jgi:casein kinase 1
MSRPQFKPLVINDLRLPSLTIDTTTKEENVSDAWTPPLPNSLLSEGKYTRNNISPLLDVDMQQLLKKETPKSPNTRFLAGSPYSPNSSSAGEFERAEHIMPQRIGKRFLLGHKVGNGSFGTIYAGKNMVTNEDVAIKLEPLKTRAPQLLYESRLYKMIGMDISAAFMSYLASSPTTRSPYSPPSPSNKGLPLTLPPKKTEECTEKEDPLKGIEVAIGFPRLHWYGVEDSHNIMIIDFLGPSVEDLFEFCNRKFSLKTVLMLADQFISRLEYLHSKNIIHRGTVCIISNDIDIKPENFLLGRKQKGHHVYMVDFGLAKKFVDEKTMRHIKFRKNMSLTGTARYTSTNSHLGFEQSRRDDLESVGYVLVYLLNGVLPWQGLKAKTKDQRHQLIGKKKLSTSIKSLCKGLPVEFAHYFQYVRSLQFEEKPNYAHLRTLFIELFNREGYELDFQYDWTLLRKEIFNNTSLFYE